MRIAEFAFTNIAAQLAGGELLSPDVMFNTATETYPFGLPKAAACYHRSLAAPFTAKPGDCGLVAMTDYATESVFDLLEEDSLDSSSVSSSGSQHPSLEFLVVEIREGSLVDLGEGDEAPAGPSAPPPTPAPRNNAPQP